MLIRFLWTQTRTTFTAFVLLIAVGVLFASPGMSNVGAQAQNQTGFDLPSAGKVIVVLKDDTLSASAEDVAVKIGVDVDLQFDSALNGFATTATQTEISKLAANPVVDFIAPDLPIEAAVQSPSTAIPRSAITGFAAINGSNSPINVGIAILDTGVQNNHPDLRYAGGSDCTGSGTDQPVAGGTGNHGTHVAGIAGAVDNSIGVAGSAPGARIYNYKVLKNVSEGLTSWLICGINRSISNSDVRVINMSLAGFNTSSSTCSGPDPLRKAVCSANNSGKLMVAAAGNNSTDAGSYVPAKYPEVLTVGNIADANGAPGGDSYNSSSNYGGVVDISAPGTSIRSTIPGSSYGSMTGTSMASPLVAGVAALYMAKTGNNSGVAKYWIRTPNASVSMSTSAGCACSARSGSPNRMLYLGSQSSSHPAGTRNPSFSGSRATITNSFDTPNTGTSARARDGKTYTNWSRSNSPSSARITFDLGSNRTISGVKWKYAYLGYADAVVIRVTNSSGGYTDIGTFGNPSSSQTWFGKSTRVTGRFIEFIYLNPYSRPALGSLSEVEIWSSGGAASDTSFEGASLPIVSSNETSGDSALAYDGNEETTFAASSEAPTNSATFDLGEPRDLTGVRWKSEADDEVTISTSADGTTWSEAGVFDNAPDEAIWQGTEEPKGRKARYVKVAFDDPGANGATADLNELEIWGLLPPGDADPDLAGEPLPITCVSDPVSSGEGFNADKACDLNGGTNWHTDPLSPTTATLTVNLEQATELSGIKWNFAQQGNAEFFSISAGVGDQLVEVGDFSGGGANIYQGKAFDTPVLADTVVLTFNNVDKDTELGYLAEIELWGDKNASATPEASPEASPTTGTPAPVDEGTPEASPDPATPVAGTPDPEEASPIASPDPVTPTASATEEGATPQPEETIAVEPTEDVATPDPGTPQPLPTETPAPTEIPAGTPAPTETLAPTETPAPTETVTPTEIPAETAEPTATTEPTETVAPTTETTLGTISGTDGDVVNCRVSPVDGDPLVQLNEGDQVDVTGPALDGWLPVICDGQVGFISEEFITIGDVTPTEEGVEPTATTSEEASPTAEVSEEATEESTTEPTATEEPEETPYPIADTGDTEDSGAASFAIDDDASTSWSVYPSQSLEQARLYFDLGSVLPIDRLTIELATWDQLPTFEIWLSEDGETWYNATPGGINGWNLERDVPLEIGLGYDARYIRIVIPNVDEQLGEGVEVGGIRQIDVWAGDINETQYLTGLGEPTTPTPDDVVPTEEPTDEVIEEPTEEELPTEEVVEEPTEEVIPTEEVVPEEETPTEEAVG